MRRTFQVVRILGVCCFFLGFSALGEHQTSLRGVINVAGVQGALLEIEHTLANVSNASPVTITTSEFVSEGQRFEDKTVKGAHFQFEVLEIDFARRKVKTREAGEEHTYGLTVAGNPPAAGNCLQVKDAAFKDLLDLYSRVTGRTVLLHPGVDRARGSLEAEWPNQAPDKAQVVEVFTRFFNQRGASMIPDGEIFVQLIPAKMSHPVSAGSKGSVGGEKIGAIRFENTPLETLVRIYAGISGRRLVGPTALVGSVPYLKVSQPISKLETLYVLETLLGWNGASIVPGDDNTFSVERAK